MIRDSLCELIEKDRSLLSDPRRLEASLRDLYPTDERVYLNALLAAQREGVVSRLTGSDASLPAEILIPRLAEHLSRQAGLRDDLAYWAVESWALAVGVISQALAPSPKEPGTPSGRSAAPAVSSQQTQPTSVGLTASAAAPSSASPPVGVSPPSPARPARPSPAATRRTPTATWRDRRPWLVAGGAVVAVAVIIAIAVAATRGDESSALAPTSTVGPATTSTTVVSAAASSTGTTSSTTTSVVSPGTVLYEADWSNGMNGWVGSGDWKHLNGMLLNDGTGSSEIAPIIAPVDLGSITDYAVDVEFRVLKPRGSFGIVVRADGEGGGYAAGVGHGWGRTSGILDLSDADWGSGIRSTPLVEGKVFDPGDGWHTYHVEAEGNVITLSVDGAVLATVTDNKYLGAGQVGLWSCNDQLEVRSFKVTAG